MTAAPEPQHARRPVLITGGAGFIGCNLADSLAAEGHSLLIYDNLARPGVRQNLDWLTRRHGSRIEAIIADIRNDEALAWAVSRASAVFHFAAQVAVTSSLEDPREDFAVNLTGTFNLLDALRHHNPEAPLVFASTNKVYGDLADIALERRNGAYTPEDETIRAHGVSEDRPLDFHTPYGCSKGAADQYVLDFSRSFGLRTAVLRMSCIYGPRQMGTEDQGWVAHFIKKAIARDPVVIYGDGHQVRDVLFVEDAVAAYCAAWERIDIAAGHAFNLGGGPANAVSLRQVLEYVGELLGEPVETRFAPWRAGDQRYYVSDTRRAREALSVPAPKPWRDGIRILTEWLSEGRPAETRGIYTALAAAS